MKALLVIDIQTGLTKRDSLYNRDVFFETVNSTIIKYRKSVHLIVFIQHNNKLLQANTNDWKIDNNLDKHNSDCVVQKNMVMHFKKQNSQGYLKSIRLKKY